MKLTYAHLTEKKETRKKIMSTKQKSLGKIKKFRKLIGCLVRAARNDNKIVWCSRGHCYSEISQVLHNNQMFLFCMNSILNLKSFRKMTFKAQVGNDTY